MSKAKYILKRILLMLLTLFIITTICFMLIRLLPRELPTDKALAAIIAEREEAQGLNEPLLVQYFLYLKNLFLHFDLGTSWYIAPGTQVTRLLADRLLPTVLINVYSLLISAPLGILLGVCAAIFKNRAADHAVSAGIMLFVSVPSYIYAFLLQYVFYFKLGWFPQVMYSLSDAGGSWFSPRMLHSMVLPVLALSFGEIASLCRHTRAELGETLRSDYMLLARAKGLSPYGATVRHALKNAMVPILPLIVAGFVGVLEGSVIIEQIFSIPGVGQLYVNSVKLLDYDVFMADSIFYTFIGLSAQIVIDVCYGLIDPRIRIGER